MSISVTRQTKHRPAIISVIRQTEIFNISQSSDLLITANYQLCNHLQTISYERQKNECDIIALPHVYPHNSCLIVSECF